jgi:hypothetical protein
VENSHDQDALAVVGEDNDVSRTGYTPGASMGPAMTQMIETKLWCNFHPALYRLTLRICPKIEKGSI